MRELTGWNPDKLCSVGLCQIGRVIDASRVDNDYFNLLERLLVLEHRKKLDKIVSAIQRWNDNRNARIGNRTGFLGVPHRLKGSSDRCRNRGGLEISVYAQ